jgi:hypothetical protein
MIRNLKTLVSVLAMFAALNVVAASSASAQTLTSTGPVTLVGTQTGEAAKNQFSAFGGTTTCANAKYTGYKYNVTPHTFIPNDVSTFTVRSLFGFCSSKIGAASFPTTVDINGCDWVMHVEEPTPFVGTHTVKNTFICVLGSHFTFNIFATNAKHTSNEPFCQLTITESAAGYFGLDATDTTNGKIDISGTISGISVDKKSPTGSILCPEETTSTATLSLDITLEGKNEAGGATSISLSHL